ncbi:MAG: hypothetical protein WDW36_001868 [Sanguina aurantia]
MPIQISTTSAEFRAATDAQGRYKALLKARSHLQPFLDADKLAEHRVMGCTAQIWVTACLEQDVSGQQVVRFNGTSDSELSAGLLGLLVGGLNGMTPAQVMQLDPSVLQPLQLNSTMGMSPSRVNGFYNMLQAMKRRASALVSALPRFPSLLITKDSLTPQGAFAEAQAAFLTPQPDQITRLVSELSSKQVGIVAHFYMDPQVQGVLSAAALQWPHIHISDSLVMADRAVAMAVAGCRAIAVLGVDFMSENVRAILDQAGFQHVLVYRLAAEEIGCSLAEAAEGPGYASYLAAAAAVPASLHVVYINTSLRTKALSDAAVPTITCTSSNVVQTIMQAFAQVPEANVFYGPDTYMGRNLAQLFTSMSTQSDEEVRAVHPSHTAASVKAFLPRLRYYEDGTCIVHHIFGGETCEQVRLGYADALLAAHFEVPGEMFTLAMEAKTRGRGVVGSTSNILDFISAKVADSLAAPLPERLQFILGTESGMITSIVLKVQQMLAASSRTDVDVEIVFPVQASSITTASQGRGAGAAPLEMLHGISILPGPAAGEGCSLDGGCAACPYMRMNSLSALFSVLRRVGTPGGEAMLAGHLPKPYTEMVDGRTMAQAGCVPILHMRHFQNKKALSDELVADMRTRHA